jgi:hypothetical protein
MKSEMKAYLITGAFEGVGGFSNLTGNFDGAGISFGLLQWNFISGTLQPLFKEMYKNGPVTFKRCCTVNGVDYSQNLLSACNMSNQRAVEWSKNIQCNNKINPVWKIIFSRLGENEVYQHIQMRFAEKSYMARAKADMKYLGVKTERALVLLFDIAVQNGGLRPAHKLLIDRNKKGIDLLKNVAEAVASCARKEFQKDVLSRKMCIVNGKGRVHRVNYDLTKTYGLCDNLLGV